MAEPNKLQSKFTNGSILKKLVRIFRTNTVVRHHFQSTTTQAKPVGTAQAFFADAYSLFRNATPMYSSYDRFARYSDYSEADSDPIISNALNIYADETTQRNENGKILDVVSEDKKIRDLLQELFDDVLQLNSIRLWKLVRMLCKYGDAIYLIDITEENGVVNLIHMPINEVEREENFDKDQPGAVRFRWTSKNNVEIPNAYVAHFRISGNDMFAPYGFSVIEPARRPWRQLLLLIDAMMAYRISRAAERRIFMLDVLGIDPNDREVALQKFAQSIKKKPLIDEKGNMDLRYGSSLEIDADYVIPIMGDSKTRIETLPGAQNLGDIEDIQFIRENLFAAIGIPKAYLTFDNDQAKAVLTQEDIRFARTIARVQEAVIAELIKIAMIHLYVKGYRGKDLTNFKIKMTNPSTVAELQKNELWRSRMELVQAASEGVFDSNFIYLHFLKLSRDQIDAIRKGQIQDKIFQAKLMAIENAQGAVNMGQIGGMGAMGGMGGMGGMGMPSLGGPMDVGGGMPNMGGAPVTPGVGQGGVPITGEALAPHTGKNLSRDASGDSRKRTRRGIENIDTSPESSFIDDDPADIKGLKRSITSPMSETKVLEEFKALLDEYNKLLIETEDKTNSGHPEMTDEIFEEFYPCSAEPKSVKSVKAVLQETLKKTLQEGTSQQLDQDVEDDDITPETNWESKVTDMDDRISKIISDIYFPKK